MYNGPPMCRRGLSFFLLNRTSDGVIKTKYLFSIKRLKIKLFMIKKLKGPVWPLPVGVWKCSNAIKK